MSRITTPDSIATSPAAARPLLEAVEKQLGSVPNMFRVVGNSPAALEGYLGLNGALAKGSLGAKLREGIALVVAEQNGCDYCLSAHTFLGKNVAKLEDGEMEANRDGRSSDARVTAALRFASRVVGQRGRVSDADLAAVKQAGFDDGQIIEIVHLVVLNTLTNYVNLVAQTDNDFPVVTHRAR